MKLTTVIGSVNLNPQYYMFIPKQILFWKHFNINFIAVIVGENIPDELKEYSNNIILWNKNLHLNTAFVAQNLRMYYSALINLPDDEMVMMTDMDMLPMSKGYYTDGLEHFTKNDFIYYRHIDGNQIYMCYNSAHPHTWGKVFGITSQDDIERKINDTYNNGYSGVPGHTGWFIDQEIMYKNLINYPHLKVLNRPIRRLEMWDYNTFFNNGSQPTISNYDDAHFHRSYFNNINYLLNAEKQLLNNY
jgi:hypothetical protein